MAGSIYLLWSVTNIYILNVFDTYCKCIILLTTFYSYLFKSLKEYPNPNSNTYSMDILTLGSRALPWIYWFMCRSQDIPLLSGIHHQIIGSHSVNLANYRSKPNSLVNITFFNPNIDKVGIITLLNSYCLFSGPQNITVGCSKSWVTHSTFRASGCDIPRAHWTNCGFRVMLWS